MKSLSAQLRSHVRGTTTTLVMCWLIERADGEVYAFTEHDQALTFALDGGTSHTYRPESAFVRSDISTSSQLSVSNMDVEGVAVEEHALSFPLMLEPDIRAGLFDYADLWVFLVNWSDLTQGDLPYFRGKLGEFQIEDGRFRFEVRSLTQQLTKRLTEVYTEECRADLFDTRCTLNSADFREDAAVDTVIDTRRFIVDAPLTAVPTDYWDGGLLVWETGANAGLKSEIKSYFPGPIALSDSIGCTFLAGTGGAADTITRNSGSFITDGWRANMNAVITETAANDATRSIASVTALVLTLTTSGVVVNVADIDVTLTSAETEVIELYLPAQYTIEAGDEFYVLPGCDKKLGTCRDKYLNVLNFVGEPFLPGRSAITQTPDAS